MAAEATGVAVSTEDDETAPRIAISGITGYVGHDLTSLLIKTGCRVLGLIRHPPSAVAKLPPTAMLRRIDDRTETLCEHFEEFRPDIVVHLAALARRSHLVTDVTPFLEANVLLGARMLEAMRICGCRRFITAESILQFSDTGEPRAMNLYAATKLAFAEILGYYTSAFGVSAIALVLPTLYSERETRPKLMTDIAAALLNGTSVDVQAGDVKVDFVHTEDVASAVARAIEILKDRTPEPGSLRRYWISSGRNVTTRELITLFEHMGERKIDVRWRHSQVNSRRTNPWCGPILPGWTPQIDLETGIKRMLSRQR